MVDAMRDQDRPGSAGHCASVPDSSWRRAFSGEASQLSAVRQWVKSLLPTCAALDDVTVVATELASNAIRHTTSGRGGCFTIDVSWSPKIVQVAVTDLGAPNGPQDVAEPDGEHGRGLLVVTGLSIRTGVFGDVNGRTVWAVIRWDEAVSPEPEPAELAWLRADHPAFRFRYARVGRHGRCWIAERQNGLMPGVHTVITADLAELRAALIHDTRPRESLVLTTEQVFRALL